MKLACPSCGRPVRRASGGEAPVSAGEGFSFAELLSGAYWCENCGRIAKDAFSEEDQKRIRLATVGYVALSLVALAFVLGMIMLGVSHGRWLGR